MSYTYIGSSAKKRKKSARRSLLAYSLADPVASAATKSLATPPACPLADHLSARFFGVSAKFVISVLAEHKVQRRRLG